MAQAPMPDPVGPENTTEEDAPVPFYLQVEDPEPRVGLARLLLQPTIALNTLRVALPVVLGMVTQTAISILDTVMVGRLPPEVANPGQAAIGFSLPLMWLVGGSLSSVWVGTQAITSRRFGEGKLELAGRTLTNSVAVALVASIVISGLAFLAVPSVIGALYADPASVALGQGYLRLRLLGVTAMVTTFSFKSFFDGIGRTHYFMAAAVVMNVLNGVLNWVLINGVESLGVPALGVEGAAWASAIASYIGLFLLFGVALQPSLMRQFKYLRPSSLDGSVAREIIRLSVPNGGATLIIMVGFSAFYWVVGQLNDQIAPPGNPFIATASQAVVTLNMVTFMTALAFGSATASIVGQAVGAKRTALGERYGWEAAKLWAYLMTLFGLLLFVAPDFFVALVNPDPLVIDAARAPLRLLALLQGVVAIAMVFAQTLYGTGDAKFVLGVELALHLGVMAPGAYLFGLVFDLGLVGIYIAPAIYGCALATATLLRFRRGHWKTVEL